MNIVAILALNQGAIVYFNGNCPDGYIKYDAAQGKFIIGIDSTYELGKPGGSKTKTLSKDQMPRHNHTNGIYN